MNNQFLRLSLQCCKFKRIVKLEMMMASDIHSLVSMQYLYVYKNLKLIMGKQDIHQPKWQTEMLLACCRDQKLEHHPMPEYESSLSTKMTKLV